MNMNHETHESHKMKICFSFVFFVYFVVKESVTL